MTDAIGILSPKRIGMLSQDRCRAVALNNPGRGKGRTWAYLPDAGEAIARLLDRAGELEPFARFHFRGEWDPEGLAMVRAVAEGVGRPDTRVKGLPWALLGVAGLFAETPRELCKMRYLWRAPVRLDNGKLVAFLGEEPHTPLGEAVRRTLAALKVG